MKNGYKAGKIKSNATFKLGMATAGKSALSGAGIKGVAQEIRRKRPLSKKI